MNLWEFRTRVAGMNERSERHGGGQRGEGGVMLAFGLQL